MFNILKLLLTIIFVRFIFLLYCDFVSGKKLSIAVFSSTRKKNRKLLIRGYEFVVDRQLKQGTNWRCSRYKSARCKARATTHINPLGVEHYFLRNPQHTHSCEHTKKGQSLY